MKKISIILALFCAVAFLLPGITRAQSITLDSVVPTHFCAGDPVSVTFTITGTWLHKNAFTLQLSDDSGRFAGGFTNLGSVIDTLPGTFTIISSIPVTAIQSPIYRLRVIGTNPYYLSADNGSDIAIGALPSDLEFGTISNTVIGHPINFSCSNTGIDNRTDSVFWDFGTSATPRTVSGVGHSWEGTTTYATGGMKTVSVRAKVPGGCSRTISTSLRVYDCSTPLIPADAHVVTSDASWHELGRVIWVNPGVKLTLFAEYGDTVFAEAGSTITDMQGNSNIIYLNAGSSYISQSATEGVIVYSDSASVALDPRIPEVSLQCPSFHFDYTIAPPNSIMHIKEAVILSKAASAAIQLSPNPTSGVVDIQGWPPNARAEVLNVLGKVVQHVLNVPNSDFALDLSKLSAGTYYIRFASNSGVLTKKIVKE